MSSTILKLKSSLTVTEKCVAMIRICSLSLSSSTHPVTISPLLSSSSSPSSNPVAQLYSIPPLISFALLLSSSFTCLWYSHHSFFSHPLDLCPQILRLVPGWVCSRLHGSGFFVGSFRSPCARWWCPSAAVLMCVWSSPGPLVQFPVTRQLHSRLKRM